MGEMVVNVEKEQQRNIAVDAYRGLVMLLMMAGVLRLPEVAQSFPGNPIWQFLAFQQSHIEWAGMSLEDTIQPGFTFLVVLRFHTPSAAASAKATASSACWAIPSGAVLFSLRSASFFAPSTAP